MLELQQLPIIDAHHHLWDPLTQYHPWLSDDKEIDFRYGSYQDLRRPFLPQDYYKVARGLNIVGHVTMEGEWDPLHPTGESAWLDRVRQQLAFPHAHVARAFLDQENVEETLEQHAAYPWIRGIRHKPTVCTQPHLFRWEEPGSLSDARWRRGYAMLQKFDLHFELQAPWWHFREALDLVETRPEIPMVVNHAGLPFANGGENLAGWAEAIRDLARAPKIYVKISGLGRFDKSWDPEVNRYIVEKLIETFGCERLMFASNFPVDSLCRDFYSIWQDFWRATESLTIKEREYLFSLTAARVYRLTL